MDSSSESTHELSIIREMQGEINNSGSVIMIIKLSSINGLISNKVCYGQRKQAWKKLHLAFAQLEQT